MKYEGKTVYSSGEIADLLGFDDYHRVSNYLKKIGAKNVTKKGNTRYYSEKTKETVITYFKALEHKGSGESKKDQLIEELRTQLRKAQQENVANLAEQKKEYDSKLDEQKESYERLIAAKNDDISNLKDTFHRYSSLKISAISSSGITSCNNSCAVQFVLQLLFDTA